ERPRLLRPGGEFPRRRYHRDRDLLKREPESGAYTKVRLARPPLSPADASSHHEVVAVDDFVVRGFGKKGADVGGFLPADALEVGGAVVRQPAGDRRPVGRADRHQVAPGEIP